MSTRVGWAPEAIDAFEEIFEFLDRLSPRTATAFATDVSAALDRVATFPEIGGMVPEFENRRLREVPVGPCRLIYRLHFDGIEVETIIHGSVQRPGQPTRD